MKSLGIITYQCPHLKTEQVLLSLSSEIINSFATIKVFALPFKKYKGREVLIPHRPAQDNAVSVDIICSAYGYEYVRCYSDTDITNDCDMYIITGAGILSKQTVRDKKIINCHPGIIPAVRGLDSFKWAIYHMLPIGNTLHYISQEVDMGTIISIIPTPVFSTDSLLSLARRHYEQEINILSNFQYHIANPTNEFSRIEEGVSSMRMSIGAESEMCRKFDEYKDRFAKA